MWAQHGLSHTPYSICTQVPGKNLYLQSPLPWMEFRRRIYSQQGACIPVSSQGRAFRVGWSSFTDLYNTVLLLSQGSGPHDEQHSSLPPSPGAALNNGWLMLMLHAACMSMMYAMLLFLIPDQWPYQNQPPWAGHGVAWGLSCLSSVVFKKISKPSRMRLILVVFFLEKFILVVGRMKYGDVLFSSGIWNKWTFLQPTRAGLSFHPTALSSFALCSIQVESSIGSTRSIWRLHQ